MNKFMRLLIMFDLPTLTKAERRAACQFRSFLKKDGFAMLQWSVYSRICNGMDSVEEHKKRIKANLPRKGSVRALLLTEKQFESFEILLGNRNKSADSAKNLMDVF